MHPSIAFARRWWLAAQFPIGANNTVNLTQIVLPPGPVPNTGRDDLDYSLGFELGQALLKLRRPWPALPGQEVEIDDGPDYLANLSSRIGYGLAVDWVRMGFLGAVETMTNVALNKPDMLSAVASRLDRLTDPAIRARIAYLWEAGEPLPTVFDDGFDSVTMATTTPRVR